MPSAFSLYDFLSSRPDSTRRLLRTFATSSTAPIIPKESIIKIRATTYWFRLHQRIAPKKIPIIKTPPPMMGGAPVYGFKSAGAVIKSEVIPFLRKARMTYGISHTIRKYAVKNAIPPRKTTDLKTWYCQIECKSAASIYFLQCHKFFFLCSN